MIKYKIDHIRFAPLRQQVLDMVVNHGAGEAFRMLQKAINNASMPKDKVEVDLILGPQTRNAINQHDKDGDKTYLKEVNNNLVDLRINFYKSLVTKDETQKAFLVGWKNRAKTFIIN